MEVGDGEVISDEVAALTQMVVALVLAWLTLD